MSSGATGSRTTSTSSGRRSVPRSSGIAWPEEYAPETVAAITGVDVETIETLAHRLAREQPSLIRLNYGLQRHRGGGMAVRTIACIPAVDRLVAASRRRRAALDERNLRLRHGPADSPRPVAARHAARQHEPARRGARRRAAWPAGPCPLRLQLQPGRRRTQPGEGASRGSSAKTCSSWCTSSIATDTVDYADIVLPATSQLEQIDIHGSYGHHDVMFNDPAIAPRGECRSNNDVFRELASRLGFEPELFPDDETLDPGSLERRPDARGDHARAASRRRANSPEHPRRLTRHSPTVSFPRLPESASCIPSG